MRRTQINREVLRLLAAVCVAVILAVLTGASRQDSVDGGPSTTNSVDTSTTSIPAATSTSAPGGEGPGDGAPETSTTTSIAPTSTTTPADTTTSSTTTSTVGTVENGGSPGQQNGDQQPGPAGNDEVGGEQPSGAPTPGAGRPASVRNSQIPVSSIVLSVAVIAAMAVGAWLVARRKRSIEEGGLDESDLEAGSPEQPRRAEQHGAYEDGAAESSTAEGGIANEVADSDSPADQALVSDLDHPGERVRVLNLLIAVGEALLDSGAAVPQVEATIQAIARRFGIEDLSAIILPNSLILSMPDELDVQTGTGTSGSLPLRLDQIDDVTRLVRRILLGQVSASEAQTELRGIHNSEPPTEPKVLIAGHALAAVAIVIILGGTWREVLIGCFLGGIVGSLLIATRRLENIAYAPLQPLIVATISSTIVFASTRVISGLIVFPLLIASLVTFLPGGKLTMSVLELVTGHMVSGSARLMFGAMQLVLLAMGLAAGGQLVGAGQGVRTNQAQGLIAGIAPWFGVAVFGLGIMMIHGVYKSSRVWMLLVLYVAYAGQVIGALFFGPSLSAFFGALAMTPVAILASRQPAGPSPLVTFLPAFWILVPGALGLQGVTLLIDGSGGVDTLLVVLTSMVGISLGILVGLALVTDSRSGWWIGDLTMSDPWLERKFRSWRE